MAKQTLLITGITGFLGFRLAEAAVARYSVVGITRKAGTVPEGCRLITADISQADTLAKALEGIKPDFAIHAAAEVSVAACESNPAQAYAVNVTGTQNMLAALPKECRFIHISTDSVFDGSKGNYSEQDAANPVHVYGKSKLQAEAIVLREQPQALIVRTVFIGMNRCAEGSLAQWFLEQLRNNADCPGFTDVYFSPIEAGLLASRILELMTNSASGRLHVAGRESCSKYVFARRLAKLFGFSEDKIRPVVSDSLKLSPPRPKNVTLNVSLAESLLGRQLPGLDESLRALTEPVTA